MNLLSLTKLPVIVVALLCCSSERMSTPSQHDTSSIPAIPVSADYKPSNVLGNGSKDYPCKCNYIVPVKHEHDGEKLGLKPGDVICLKAGVKYGPLKFVNLHGTQEKPITIVNCGGPVHVD